MPRRISTIVLVSSLLLVAGCASFEIEGAGDVDLGPDRKTESETIHGSFWGIKWKDRAISKCEKNHELYRVEYHDNALYAIISVASLGLYVPQSVEWWCAKRPDNEDEGPSLENREDR